MNLFYCRWVFFLALIMGVLSLHAQEELSRKAKRKARPTYLRLTTGISPTSVRDFQTSPLTYTAPLGITAGLSYLGEDTVRHQSFGFQFNYGNATQVSETATASASLYLFQGYYAYLQQLSLNDANWNLKVGGTANLASNIRINPSLGNASSGIEFIGTLFASGKIEGDVSRRKTKEKKFLFLNWTKVPRKRKLSFLTNIGILNTNYRNAYAYVTETVVTQNPRALADHSWKVSGFRMQTELLYTTYLKNGNAIGFAYKWDAYTTGNGNAALEVAMHQLTFNLFFSTKKVQP